MQIVAQWRNAKYIFHRIIIYINPFWSRINKIPATFFLYFISGRWSLFGGFRHIYNRKEITFVAPVNNNRRIEINAFPCADNRKQVERRIIFFSSFHKAWFVWVIDFVYECYTNFLSVWQTRWTSRKYTKRLSFQWLLLPYF